MNRSNGLWRILRPRLGVAALGGVLVAALLMALWLFWNHEEVLEWKREAEPFPFFVLMAVVPALGFPITPLFVLAGAVFGATVGLIGSLLALAVNLLLCHWIAHSTLRPHLQRVLARTRYRLPRFSGNRRGALQFILLVRITPGVPLFIKNYLIGFSDIALRLHFGISILLTGTYGAGFVLLGESMLEHDVFEAIIAAVILGLVSVAVVLLRRYLRRASTRPQDAGE
jgi:uncharacterized membrane protein YdjX (TVP38/TMEM64 family)